MAEKWCKISVVQGQVAMLKGWQLTLNGVGSESSLSYIAWVSMVSCVYLEVMFQGVDGAKKIMQRNGCVKEWDFGTFSTEIRSSKLKKDLPSPWHAELKKCLLNSWLVV